MRRELASILFLILSLGLFAGYAWLTRHPEAPILERAEDWPVVGPLASRFREAYLPGAGSPASPRDDADRSMDDGSPTGTGEPEIHDARPWIWVQEGTEIRAAPFPDSPLVVIMDAIANLPYEERRGDWYRVRRGDTVGWARVSGRPLAWRREGDGGGGGPSAGATVPVLPLRSRPPDPAWLAAGLEILGPDAVETTVGPYRLYTDLPQPRFVGRIGVVVSQLEDLYRERYGLEPVEGALEVIVLFALEEDYEAFSRKEEWLRGLDATAHVARGVVALYAEGRSRGGVISSLLHELTHLLNRRSVGPALPPWLDEGIADDLSMSRVDPDGRIRPGTLGGETRRSGRQVLRRGGRATAVLLQGRAEEGELLPLHELTRLDWPAFVAEDKGPIHYAQSAFFVRFLLSDWLAGTRSGFRSFLADTARGEPISQEALRGRLGWSWAELEQGFRVWLQLQFLMPLDEVPE